MIDKNPFSRVKNGIMMSLQAFDEQENLSLWELDQSEILS
jgi:hypothetical protein